MRTKARIERVGADVSATIRAFFSKAEVYSRSYHSGIDPDGHLAREDLRKINDRREEAFDACKNAEQAPEKIPFPSDLFDDIRKCFAPATTIRFSPLYLFKDRLYAADGPFTDQEIALLVRDEFDKERRQFERLACVHEGSSVKARIPRERIPESVRIKVWRRDGGRCARCSSRERLEFDHIVPVSEGGGNTERNVELLCERCNRTKGNKIQ